MRQLREVWFRLRWGYWCDEHYWSPWQLDMTGTDGYRRCERCGRTEWKP